MVQNVSGMPCVGKVTDVQQASLSLQARIYPSLSCSQVLRFCIRQQRERVMPKNQISLQINLVR
jgi:hypothetical protein